jgi:prepilin signal peptidase PulO-like enzyme (type II secretory pathway)
LPRDLPFGCQRSRCTECSHALSFIDLIPLLSWLFQRGKCRYCQAKIHWRYPLIELAQMLMFLEVFRLYGMSANGFIFAALSVALLLMLVIDLEFKIIPDSLQIFFILLGILYRYSGNLNLLEGLAAAALLSGGSFLLRAIFWRVRKREGLGLGDVKFFFAAGIWLGFMPIPAFLLLSGSLGILLAVLWQKFFQQDEFPFAPALAIAMWICLNYSGVSSLLVYGSS